MMPRPPSMSSTDTTASAISDDWAYSDAQYAFYAEHYPEYALEDEAIAEAYRRVAENRASAVPGSCQSRDED